MPIIFVSFKKTYYFKSMSFNTAALSPSIYVTITTHIFAVTKMMKFRWLPFRAVMQASTLNFADRESIRKALRKEAT